jgi:S1-C subfamily serine protease
VTPLAHNDARVPARRTHVRRELALAAVAVALIAGAVAGHLVWSSGQASKVTPATQSKPAAVKGSIASRVDPGLVDIDTSLAYEGAAAAGTGIVVTSSGEVITNNHVIEGATSISATDVGDGETYSAQVIGYDHSHDVAVLALEGASRLATVSFGNSSSVRVGERIVTIGNAGGVGGTPSAAGGSVVALNQSVFAGDELDGIPEQLSGLIEIKGALVPGDSGGPLVNDAALVIGMDTAASSSFQFESSAGEGVAIPTASFTSIARQIVAGHASAAIHIGKSAFLGVLVATASAQSGFPGPPGYHAPSVTGALIEDVLQGTPAAGAGLAGGGVITALDDHTIDSASALTALMDLHHPGELVQLTWEDVEGAQHTATVRLANGPPD